jgi:hypothetical protein
MRRSSTKPFGEALCGLMDARGLTYRGLAAPWSAPAAAERIPTRPEPPARTAGTQTSRPAAISASKGARSSATMSKIAPCFRGIKGLSPRPAKDPARGPNDNMTITIMSSATPPDQDPSPPSVSLMAPAVTTQRVAQQMSVSIAIVGRPSVNTSWPVSQRRQVAR